MFNSLITKLVIKLIPNTLSSHDFELALILPQPIYKKLYTNLCITHIFLQLIKLNIRYIAKRLIKYLINLT